MNSVDSVDIIRAAFMERCPHCPSAKVWWVTHDVGKPPEFIFEGFPREGLVILSKTTVVVYCEKCSQVNLEASRHATMP